MTQSKTIYKSGYQWGDWAMTHIQEDRDEAQRKFSNLSLSLCLLIRWLWPIRFCHILIQPVMRLLSNLKSLLLSSAVSRHSVTLITHLPLIITLSGSSNTNSVWTPGGIPELRSASTSHRILMTSHGGLKRPKTNIHITSSLHMSINVAKTLNRSLSWLKYTIAYIML